MQDIRALIFEAAHSEGRPQERERRPSSERGAARNEVLQMLASGTAASAAVGDEAPFASAMGIARRLMESKRTDENRLGLESLCDLSDSSKSLDADAKRTAVAVLADAHLLGLVEKYLGRMGLSKSPGDDDDATMSYEDGNFSGCCHILALRLLANVLDSAGPEGRAKMVNPTSTFWRKSVEAFYYNLSVAPSRPLEASMSIKSLRLLQATDPSSLDLAPRDRELLRGCLRTAHRHGRLHFADLEAESELLIEHLG